MFHYQANSLNPKPLQSLPHSQQTMPIPSPYHAPTPLHSPATRSTQFLAPCPTTHLTHPSVSCQHHRARPPPHPAYTAEWGGWSTLSPTLDLSHKSIPQIYDPPPPYQPPHVTPHPPITFSPHQLHLSCTPHPWPSHSARTVHQPPPPHPPPTYPPTPLNTHPKAYTLNVLDPPPPYQPPQPPLIYYQPLDSIFPTVHSHHHPHLTQTPQTPQAWPSHTTHTTEQDNRRAARLKAQHIAWAPLLTVQQSVANRLDRNLLDILLDEGVWPNGSTSLPSNSFISFRAPGGNVCDEDLFQLNVNQTTSYCSPSRGFISSSCINFVLACLAEEQGQPTHTPVDVWLIGSNIAAVSPWLSRRLVGDETVQVKSLALYAHFNPSITQTLIVPINLNNFHWLAIIMDFKLRTITTYDSSVSILTTGRSQLTIRMEGLAIEICRLAHITGEWTSTVASVLQQENPYDCGSHTIATCILASANFAREAELTHAHTRNVRRWLLWKLLSHFQPEATSHGETSTFSCRPTATESKEPANEMPVTNMQDISNGTYPNSSDARLSTSTLEISALKKSPLATIFPPNEGIPGLTSDQPSVHTIIFSANVGPSGIRDSILHLLPLFIQNPGVVMIQDARLTALSTKSFCKFANKLLPEYALFTRTSFQGNRDEVRVVTFVHRALAARGTQVDISKLISPNSTCSVRELASRLQVIRTTDVHTDTVIMWMNIYNYQSKQHREQQALLDLINILVAEWGPKVQHIVCGGDWNASISPRFGYTADSVTSNSDRRLCAWLKSSPINTLKTIEPTDPTWCSHSHDQSAVLDRFLVRLPNTPTCMVLPAQHVVHDHSIICMSLDDSIISPLPPKWNIMKPKRLKMEHWSERRGKWSDLVSQRISKIPGSTDLLSRADTAQTIALSTAKEVLGMSGGNRASLIPFHSSGFRKLVSTLRIVKSARTDLMKRRDSSGPRPPSKSMRDAWDRGILPLEKCQYSTISDPFATNNAEWSKAWLQVLRERFEALTLDLKALRHSEISKAAVQARESRISRMSLGGSGEIQRLLGKKGPLISSPFVATEYPNQIKIICSEQLSELQEVISLKTPTVHITLGQEQTSLECHESSKLQALYIANIPACELGSLLELADGHEVYVSCPQTHYVHTPSDRLTAWESHLAGEAAATRMQCSCCHCPGLIPVSVTAPTRTIRHFCSHCCTFSNATVEEEDYETLPFPTENIPKVPLSARETLSGAITYEDLKFRISKLSRGKAAGEDGILYEFLIDGPDELLNAVLDAINGLLTKTLSIPEFWKGGMIKLLYKKGDSTLCKNYRPVVLLRACYKLYTSILTDRLYTISERHNLLHPLQEGFRRHRSCGRQAQSLFWAYQEAKKRKETIVVAFLDFANAFNSVDHPALWRWLREIGVPDVDMLKELYSDSYYQADTVYGTSAKIFLTRGTKQGDGLSPLLFSLIFNYLLHVLDAKRLGHKSTSGTRTPGRAFADDITLVTNSNKSMAELLNAVDEFCKWSGMRVNVSKSEISAWDFNKNTTPDVSTVTMNGTPLEQLLASKAFRYLGFRFSLSGSWDEEIAHIFSVTSELVPIVTKHGYTTAQMSDVMHSVATARFRYSAALVPWTDKQLNKLHTIWIRLQKGAWRLPSSYPGALFKFPEEQGGMPVAHPKVFLLQALTLHVEQLTLHQDDILLCAQLKYKELLKTYGCHSQQELTQALIESKPLPDCPMARLLSLSNNLNFQAQLPFIITGDDITQLSWYGLRCRVQDNMESDNSCSSEDKNRGLFTLSHWMQAATLTGVSRPTRLPWKQVCGTAQWITPCFKPTKLCNNFSFSIETWGKPNESDLEPQMFDPAPAFICEVPNRLQPVGIATPTKCVLNKDLISIIMHDPTESVTNIGSFVLATARSLTRVDHMAEGKQTHVCTVTQARLGFLRNQNADCLNSLGSWARIAQLSEANKCCLSAQAYFYLQKATSANLTIGNSPLCASSEFLSSWTNTVDREGWTRETSQKQIPIIFITAMSERDQQNSLEWLTLVRPKPWYVLARTKSCSNIVKRELHIIGKIACHLKRGLNLLARVGSWRTGDIRASKSSDDWVLWVAKDTLEDQLLHLEQQFASMPLTSSGKIPLSQNNRIMQEAVYGPAGQYYNLAGTIAATDGSVRADGCMGCSAVFLDGRPAICRGVHGDPCSTTAELSGLLVAIEASSLEEPLTILTDSMTSLQNLVSMHRNDFCRDLQRHPQRRLITDLVNSLNNRASAGARTLFVKVRAHTGEPMNEAADEAADHAVESDPPGLSEHDQGRCYFTSKIAKLTCTWGPRLRKVLTESLACSSLAALRESKQSLDEQEEPRKSKHMNRTETFLSRSNCGRELLGKALRVMHSNASSRRLLQTIGDALPVQAKLQQWRLSPFGLCPLCGTGTETLCHAQCLCPALQHARRKAHHHGWETTYNLMYEKANKNWTLRREMSVASLKSLPVPPDRSMDWERLTESLHDDTLSVEDPHEEAIQLISELITDIKSSSSDRGKLSQIVGGGESIKKLLSEAYYEDPTWLATTLDDPTELLDMLEDELEHNKAAREELRRSSIPLCSLERKRPDGIAINWKKKKICFLEYTRCFDSSPTSLSVSDTYKIGKYTPVVDSLIRQLGHGWTGNIMSFSIGIRGSIDVRNWTHHMSNLGIPASTIPNILQASVHAVLDSLDFVYVARTAALKANSKT